MIAIASALFADFGSNGHMDWDGGWWVVMAFGMVLFWGLVILAVVWLAREFGPSRASRRTPSGPDATGILDRRLAEGEISPEEYRERRAVLGGESEPDVDTR